MGSYAYIRHVIPLVWLLSQSRLQVDYVTVLVNFFRGKLGIYEKLRISCFIFC